jgi:hypothetical protein
MLARTLAEVEEERGDFAAAAGWAEKALAGMQGVVGVKVGPQGRGLSTPAPESVSFTS